MIVDKIELLVKNQFSFVYWVYQERCGNPVPKSCSENIWEIFQDKIQYQFAKLLKLDLVIQVIFLKK